MSALVAMLAGCHAERGHTGMSSDARQAQPVAMSDFEQGEARRLQAEYQMSSADATTNIMLTRYTRVGHTLRNIGDGLYEVLDKDTHQVIATFKPRSGEH